MTVEKRILVVDDDPEVAQALASALGPPAYACSVVTSGAAALAACGRSSFDLVISDVRMEGMDGQELLRRLKHAHPGMPVVLVTGDASVPAAVEAVKAGAFEYIEKPFTAAALRAVVERAIASSPPASAGGGPRALPAATEELVGSGPAMTELRERIALVATALSAVLVLGETGTGKELVARAIHASSARRAAPFVTVNTSAIPEALLESEMFGHVRGAFTGAAQAHRGLFLEADGGTLLLDEIGDMPLGLQAKLLRVLQSGEIRPVGADRDRHVDVRIVAATHRKLPDLVRLGRFRDDLYYRLNVVVIVVPSLRDRSEDIPELARCLLERARARAPHSPAESIADDLVAVLSAAPYPGNVRELESLIERLVVLAQTSELTVADLARSEYGHLAMPSREPDHSLEGVIRRHVEAVLDATDGNKVRAAKLLGVDLSTLYRWQRKWMRPDAG